MKVSDLFESKSAPLYHGTPLTFGHSILESDTLKPYTTHRINGKNVKGSSLSRDINVAKKFGADDRAALIFVINQAKLTNNHKIIPHDWFASKRRRPRAYDGGESEEFVVGPVKDFHKYVDKIFYDTDILNTKHSLFERFDKQFKIWKEYGIKITPLYNGDEDRN